MDLCAGESSGIFRAFFRIQEEVWIFLEQKNICEDLLKEIKIRSDIVQCDRFDQFSGKWADGYHKHPHLELLYFIKGGALVEGDGSRSLINAGELVIYPPGYGHQEIVDFSRTQEVVCLGLRLRSGFTFGRMITVYDTDLKLQWLFTELARQYETGTPESTESDEISAFYLY